MTLKFSDGIEIDTSGEYRTLELYDGWYVTGHGILMSVSNEEQGILLIKKYNGINEYDWAMELDQSDIERMDETGRFETACPHGCLVEGDGVCPHGYRSPLLILGLT